MFEFPFQAASAFPLLADGQSLYELVHGLNIGSLKSYVALGTVVAFVVAAIRFRLYHMPKPSTAQASTKGRQRSSTGKRRRIIGAPSGSLIIADD